MRHANRAHKVVGRVLGVVLIAEEACAIAAVGTAVRARAARPLPMQHAAAASTRPRRVARLRQKALHDAEEEVTVISARLAKLEKVAAGLRRVRQVEVRDDVSYWSKTGHKVRRSGKYTVAVAASPNDEREIRIPSEQLLSDDFNELSDYFFFGTADHLTLYPSEELNENEVMHVSDLTTLLVRHAASRHPNVRAAEEARQTARAVQGCRSRPDSRACLDRALSAKH